ncbi:hypothetical protein [Amycolatopsis vastitatis]|uniref:Uncharacterized protein n=1 Tax=Amycolatopsis vastitatis TaxID=1905142 RepID=A0A229SRG4_9PSEU|nr:hypothetical protein [Amycolatopsis vastitatis]OXM61354.1 hypothetical protein CF165_38410 [Amycolatopsis vastitatis]
MGFYGDLLRSPGERSAVGDPIFTADDIGPGLEVHRLLAWWPDAAWVDRKVGPPETSTLVRVLGAAQTAIPQLSGSRLFGGLAQRALVFDLKQFRRYQQGPHPRAEARTAVGKLITAESRVVTEQAVGSVIADQALASMPHHQARARVIFDSPLGIANLIFDRLAPTPRDRSGTWPSSDDLVGMNVADRSDVALEKYVRPRFGPREINDVANNCAPAYALTAYLTDELTGAAIAGGMHAG